jgi:hypothetical protein
MASRFYPAGDSARRAAFQSERTVFRPELPALEAGVTRPPFSVFRQRRSGVAPAIWSGSTTAATRAPETSCHREPRTPARESQ